MAVMINTLLKTHYASTDLYPSSGGRFDHRGQRKTKASEIRPCQICETGVCPDFDHSWARIGACFYGHVGAQHWAGNREENRYRLMWELSNKLYPILKRVNAKGDLKSQWYENAKRGHCGCADFGHHRSPGVNAICDCDHYTARHDGGQPGD